MRFIPLVALLAAAAFSVGCGSKPAAIRRMDGAVLLTAERVREFEQAHGCTLPDDDRRFLMQYNGGFPTPDCVVFEEAGRTTATDVFCFHVLGDDRPGTSLQWHCESFAHRLPADTLPIARDACGNLWLLHVGPTHAGTVVFWDHGTFDTFDETDFNAWPKVASSFDEFLRKLQTYDPSLEDEQLLSRYAMVQQAIAGMGESFDTDAMLDRAWHCDYREGETVKLQLVEYDVHALVTHTDGYSLVRAKQGLIEAGDARLPE